MSRTPLVSVIIPTFNEAGTISAAIAQFDDLPGRWELIVADSSSSDGTAERARVTGKTVVLTVPPGRGAGMNAAAAGASGEILLFLHADTRLPENAYALVTDALRDPDVAGTGFQIRMDRPEWRYQVLTLVSRIRFRVQGTLFGDQGIAVRRDDFQRIGGYAEAILMEDVDLSRRLRRMGALRVLPAEVLTSARRFEQGGVIRTLTRMTAFQAAYRLGVPTDRLARWYAHVRSDANGTLHTRPAQIALSGLRFIDEAGNQVSPADWRGSPVVLVFLRWLG